VGVHDHPLVAVEALGLLQHVVGDADLADVVEEAASAPLGRVGQAQTRPMSTAILPGGCGRERVALVDRLGERADRLGEHLPHLDEPLRRHPGVYSGSADSSVAHHWME
jgi:hypothetical protein